MAQEYIISDGVLSRGGRDSAQSTTPVILDGKYAFKYQTAEKVRELKDSTSNIRV